MARATLGLRAHSGWAALVAVAGTPKEIEAVERRRIALIGPGFPSQPYHEAEELPVERAAKLLERCSKDSRRLALEGLREALDSLSKKGHRVVGCTLLLASGRPLPLLANILASHALIHAADGEHFRDALSHAVEKLDLPLTRIREKELMARASDALHASPETLSRRAAALGKPLGPPWTQDQKLSAIAAWLALA